MSAASRQPARMIFLRPIRSERRPNTTKNGVPIRSARADQDVGRDEVDLQRDLQEEQRVELARVPDHALPARSRRTARAARASVVRIAHEALRERRLRRACPRPSCSAKSGDSRELQPDVDARSEQHDREPERDAPAPGGERGRRRSRRACTPDDRQRQEECRASRWSGSSSCSSRAGRRARARPRRWRRRRTRRRARGPAASRSSDQQDRRRDADRLRRSATGRPATVDEPITTIVTRNVYLRPTRSPMRPKTSAPKRPHERSRRRTSRSSPAARRSRCPAGRTARRRTRRGVP